MDHFNRHVTQCNSLRMTALLVYCRPQMWRRSFTDCFAYHSYIHYVSAELKTLSMFQCVKFCGHFVLCTHSRIKFFA